MDNDTQTVDYEMWMKIYEENIAFERKIAIVACTLYPLIVVVGVIGNLLVVVVALSRQMRNSTNTLIIGLAFSDLIFLIFCVPFTIIDYSNNVFIFPEWTCMLINYLQHTSAYFSVWTLTLMAFDRFLAVCFPVGTMTLRNTKNTFIILAIMYTIICLSQLPVYSMHGIYEYDFVQEKRSACSIVSIAEQNATLTEARLYFMTFNVFGYAVPLGITSVFYYFMLRRLWHTPRPGFNHSISSSIRHRPETVKAKKKVTRLVLCVVIIWAACWLPMNICFFSSGLMYPDTLVNKIGSIGVIVQVFSQVLAYANSCLNPILYALMSDNFRKGFMRVLAVILNKLTLGFLCSTTVLTSSRMEITNCNANGSNSHSLKRLTQTQTTLLEPEKAALSELSNGYAKDRKRCSLRGRRSRILLESEPPPFVESSFVRAPLLAKSASGSEVVPVTDNSICIFDSNSPPQHLMQL